MIKDAKNSADVLECVNARIKFCKEKKMEVNPFIIVIEKDGETEFLVRYYSLEYRFQCFLEALDLVFKIFVVFNINFPKESTQFYIFLNALFYKIVLNKKKSTKVSSLLKKMCNLTENKNI